MWKRSPLLPYISPRTTTPFPLTDARAAAAVLVFVVKETHIEAVLIVSVVVFVVTAATFAVLAALVGADLFYAAPLAVDISDTFSDVVDFGVQLVFAVVVAAVYFLLLLMLLILILVILLWKRGFQPFLPLHNFVSSVKANGDLADIV